MNHVTINTSPEKKIQDTACHELQLEAQIANVVNDYEMQIWQLQAELKRQKNAREERAKLLLYQLKEQINEFDHKWFEELSDAASMELVELRHGMSVYGSKYEDCSLSLGMYRSTIELQYFMENYTFDIEQNDEFEDLDIHNFHLRRFRIDKDDLFKVNHVFGEMEALIPYLVKWNREQESLRSDIQVQIITMNMELRVLDDALKSLRKQIQELRISSFLAGNTVTFDDRKPRRIYYRQGHFVFSDQLRLVRLSASGKTCSFEAITYEKEFWSTSYHSGKKHPKPSIIEKVRVGSLVMNFYECVME